MKRPSSKELLSLFGATIAAEGVTTAAGAAAGTSLIDAALIGAGANSFDGMLAVVYPDSPLEIDSFDIVGFVPATGEVQLNHAYKGVAAAIPIGVPYKIVSFRFVPAEVAALMADVGDASTATLGSLFGILGDPAAPISITLLQAYDIVNAMLTLQETGGTLLASAVEQYVYVNDSPLGEFMPVTVQINLDNMVATEQIIVREYYRIDAAGNQELKDIMTYDGVDGGLGDGRKLINVDMEPNRFGCSVTLEMTAYDTVYKTFVWDVHVKE